MIHQAELQQDKTVWKNLLRLQCRPVFVISLIGTALLYWLCSPVFQNSTGEMKAAWVQAIGTILAVMGSIWIGERQTKAALASVERAQSLVDSAKRRSVLAIAVTGNEYAEKIGQAMSSSNIERSMRAIYDKALFETITRALAEVPIHEIGSLEGVKAFIHFSRHFEQLYESVESFNGRDFLPTVDRPMYRPEFLVPEHPLVPAVKRNVQEVLMQYQVLGEAVGLG